jgi:hypothetical protein
MVGPVALLGPLLLAVAADWCAGVVVVGTWTTAGTTSDDAAYGQDSKYEVSIRHLQPNLLQSMYTFSHSGLEDGRRDAPGHKSRRSMWTYLGHCPNSLDGRPTEGTPVEHWRGLAVVGRLEQIANVNGESGREPRQRGECDVGVR